MKKRMISFALAVLLLPAFCLSVFAYAGVGEGDGIAWSVDAQNGLTVSGEGEMENHVPAGAGWGSWIAKNITAKTSWKVRENSIASILVEGGVKRIGDAAFAHCSNSESAVMEEGVASIGSWAFLENRSMATVTIPASVTEIGNMAFYGCDGLTDVYYGGSEAMWKEVSIGESNEDLLNAAFHFTEEIPDEPDEPEAPQTPARKMGDANGDGKVNYQDAMLVLRSSIGLEELSPEAKAVSDVDGKPGINYQDAMKILRVSIGLDSFQEDPFTDSVERGVMDYEAIYIRQHLEFIGGSDYADILLVPGGLAGALGDTYEEAKLNIINNIWTFTDKVKMAVGDGEIELVNEYELLVALVMQSTGGEANFIGSYEENYFTAVLELVNGINGQLKQAKSDVDVFTGDAIDKVEELTQKLDLLIVQLQKLEGIPEKEAKGLFGEALDTVKEAFDESFIKDNETFLDTVKDGLGTALDVTDLVGKSVSDLMDSYILYNALSGASEEWEKTWTDIAAQARLSDDKIGPKLAEAIEHILNQTKDFREDESAALLNSSANIAGKHMAEYAYSAAFGVFDGMMKKSPICEAIRTGLVQGVNLANAFTNMDEIAYHGKMMAGYGHLAKIAFEVMQKKGESLVGSETYQNALLFDMAFNIYRNTQLAAFESGISYCQAMATAHAANAQLSSEKAMEAAMLLPHKLEWQGYKCHGITQILNNGGNVVGWNGNIYYFRISKGAYSKSAVYGNYSLDPKAANDLVVRAQDGSEKVIISTQSSGSIWICSNRILFRKNDKSWYYVDLQEPEKERFFTTADIIGYIPEQDMLVIQEDSGLVRTSDTRGNETEIIQGDYTAITVKDGLYYHYRHDGSGSYEFYRCDLTGKKVETLGTIRVPEISGWGRSLEDICVGEDGIYVMVGYYAGTGYFFQEGSIYYLPFGGEMKVLVDGEVRYPMMYLATEYLADGTVDNQYLHYYTSGDVLGMGLYQGAMSEGVSRYSVRTGATEEVEFPLCSRNVPFLYEGQVMLLEGGVEPTVVLDAETAADMGCGILGFREDSSAVYQTDVDKVGEDWYIVMTYSKRDPSADFGWREGYARSYTKLFRVTPETGDWELIHSY